MGSGGRPGASLGSSVAEVLTTRLEPRTGLVRAGRPGLGKRRRGWISWGQRAPLWHVLGGMCHPTLPASHTLHETHMAEELIGQTQVVVKCQEGDPLQPHHDDLRAGPEEGWGQGARGEWRGDVRNGAQILRVGAMNREKEVGWNQDPGRER